ncbi:MAG: alpha/beta hydrolase [Terracidiphilus sp.]
MVALLISFASLAAVLACAGAIYQLVGSRRDRRRLCREGRRVALGSGRNLYLLEKGSGLRTVIFESGIAATSLNWFRIQERVSEFAATASYDRFGLGWSDRSTSSRTPSNVAAELHALLQAAGVRPPYVLVGHSFGGLVMRRFALSWPEEVAGLVLVDPMRCEEWPPFEPAKQGQVERGLRMTSVAIHLARFGIMRLAVTSLLKRAGRLSQRLSVVGGSGAQHVLHRVTSEVGKLPRETWPAVAAHWSRPTFYAGVRSHVESVPHTVREMMDAPPIRQIPILVLTPGASTPLTPECLARIGDNLRQEIVEDCAHWIHLDRPELVIDSIRDLVASIAEPVPAVMG